MKQLLIGFIFLTVLFNSTVWAGADITFMWEKNLESDLAGYRLYQSDVSRQYVFGEEHAAAIIFAGTETVILSDVQDGQWYWILTAFDLAGNESDKSNEVEHLVDTIAPDAPTLKIVIILEAQ